MLLATQSFWEGVDVPGEALSLVVMDRIPFGAPDDPLTRARIDRIRDEGGDPFGGYQLPRAALSLKQGFGRLIRSRSDHGIVALLDGRVARKSYGATLRASLPAECPRTESLEDVADFWARVRPRRRPAARQRRRLMTAAIVLCLAAYVAGSIPFGILVARAKGVDLRQVGSGNIGATNVARALGKGWAVAVLAADAAKGFVPVWLGRRLGLPAGAIAAAGLAAIVGHMFTVFLRGRGGKGVATSLGVALALSPVAALIGFGVYIVRLRGHAAVVAGIPAGRLDVQRVLRRAAAAARGRSGCWRWAAPDWSRSATARTSAGWFAAKKSAPEPRGPGGGGASHPSLRLVRPLALSRRSAELGTCRGRCRRCGAG